MFAFISHEFGIFTKRERNEGRKLLVVNKLRKEWGRGGEGWKRMGRVEKDEEGAGMECFRSRVLVTSF